MRTETNSQRVLKWMKANGLNLGALTDTDVKALSASVEIVELLTTCGRRKELLEAWGAVVRTMQPSTRYFAFHGVAMAWDCGYRGEVWDAAGMSREDLRHVPECNFGPRRVAA